MKRRRSQREELLIARAQLRSISRLVRRLTSTKPSQAGTAKFVSGWAVNRGFSGITQALDEDGHVWERHSIIEKQDGQSVLKESWWEKIDMRRR